jgi:hypothetical protein
MARTFTAAVLGAEEVAVRDLLRDGLDAVGVTTLYAWPARGDVVLAFVDRGDPTEIVSLARGAARGAPVVAILPFLDDDLVRKASLAGAFACCSLARPLDELRAVVIGAIARSGGDATDPARLGPDRASRSATGDPPAPDASLQSEAPAKKGRRP